LGGGGGVVNQGKLTIDTCWIYDNIGTTGGGVLSVGPLTIRSSKIWGNTADGGLAGGYGGGVAIIGTDMTTINQISNCEIYGNEATNGGSGGGVYVGARVDMQDTNVTGNVAGKAVAGGGGDGGGVANFGVFTMTGGKIELNDADGYGGGLYSGTTQTGSGMSQVAVDDNSAGKKGGGMYVTNAHFSIINISLTNNTAAGGIPGGGFTKGSGIDGTTTAGSQLIVPDF
jgi:hypothetical protein